MAWSPQRTKLSSNKSRWGVTIIVTPSKQGDQETLCMPVRKLPAFFSSIHPEKVNPKIRETVIIFQNECDDALWSYWSQGRAVRSGSILSSIADRRPLIEACNLLVETRYLPKPVERDYAKVRADVSKFLGVDKWEDIRTEDIPKALEFVQVQIVRTQRARTSNAQVLGAPLALPSGEQEARIADGVRRAMHRFKLIHRELWDVHQAYGRDVMDPMGRECLAACRQEDDKRSAALSWLRSSNEALLSVIDDAVNALEQVTRCSLHVLEM
jgi:hypothetical protein